MGLTDLAHKRGWTGSRRGAALLAPGTTVVELGDSVAAATCARFLMHLGARVTKIEPPGGSPVRSTPPCLPGPGNDRRSALFTSLNEGKRIVEADPSTTAGRTMVEGLLLGGVDVVLISGSIDELTRGGLNVADLPALAPRAIIGSVTMFGETGPYADMAGDEVQVLALGGMMNLIGLAEREPLRLGGNQAQGAAGFAMLSGVLMGLFRRTTTARGAVFTTSVLESVAYMEWKSAASFQADGSVPRRGSDPGPLIVTCRDGFLAFYYLPTDWDKVKGLLDDPRLDDPEFATHAGRAEHRERLAAIINDNTVSLAKRDLYARAQDVGLPVGYMATMGDLLTSPQYRSRNFFVPIDLGAGLQGLLPSAPWQVILPEACGQTQ